METNQFTELVFSNPEEALKILNAEELTQESIYQGFQVALNTQNKDLIVVFLEKLILTETIANELLCNDKIFANPDLVEKLIALKPSQDALNTAIRNLDMAYIQNRDLPAEELKNFNIPELVEPVKSLETLVNAGANQDYWEKANLLRQLLLAGKTEVFNKYYQRESLPFIIQHALQQKDEKLLEFTQRQNLNFENDEGLSLINSAIAFDRPDLFDQNIEKLKDVNQKLFGNDLLVTNASQSKNPHYLKILVEKGAITDYPELNLLNATPLENAKILISQGLDVNKNGGETLNSAVQNNDAVLVKFLLENGANPKTSKNLAVKIAKENGNQEIINLLEGKGAKPLKQENYKFKIDIEKSEIKELWKAWLVYYQEFVKDEEDKTELKPSTDEELELCEKETGLKFPKDLKEIYKISSCGDELFFGARLYSPKEISEYYHFWKELGKDFIGKEENEQSKFSEVLDGKVKNEYINLKWLPFAGEEQARNYFAVDYDATEKGKNAQIINAGRDMHTRYSCAENITELARKILKRIENGETENTSEGNFSIDKTQKNIGILDAIAQLIKQGNW